MLVPVCLTKPTVVGNPAKELKLVRLLTVLEPIVKAVAVIVPPVTVPPLADMALAVRLPAAVTFPPLAILNRFAVALLPSCINEPLPVWVPYNNGFVDEKVVLLPAWKLTPLAALATQVLAMVFDAPAVAAQSVPEPDTPYT